MSTRVSLTRFQHMIMTFKKCQQSNITTVQEQISRMSTSTVIEELCLDNVNPIDDKLKERWILIEQMDNVFRYKLHVEKQKIVAGKFQFFVEVRYNNKKTQTKHFNHEVFNINISVQSTPHHITSKATNNNVNCPRFQRKRIQFQ